MDRGWGDSPGLVTLPDIEEAARRIEGVAIRTPLLPFTELSEMLGGELRLKCENLQRTGSFKIRGAFNLVSRLSSPQLERGVITYSSGNHAQALALAARIKGARAIVVMPTTASKVKVDGAKRLGAEVVFEGTTSLHRQDRAEALVAEEGFTMVPPFDHPMIIAGQGTVGREIALDWPKVDTVLAPIGGGGLSSGTAVGLKSLLPHARFIGVEAAGAASMRLALDAGKPVSLTRSDTIADGLATMRAGDLPFHHAQALFDDVVQVDDDSIRQAAALLLIRRKLVVEFSGAATVGALLSGVVDVAGKRVVAVLSGGNLDYSFMTELAGSALPEMGGGRQ